MYRIILTMNNLVDIIYLDEYRNRVYIFNSNGTINVVLLIRSFWRV